MLLTRRSVFRHYGALSAGVLLAGCNREKKRTIAVIPKGQAHLFWQSVHAGAVKAGREHGAEIVWNGPASESDFAGQLQIVERMINRHVDAIVLAPTDKQALVGVVDRATRENIPVVIFDSGIDTDKFVAQVATDNYHAGEMAADRLGKLLGGKGKVVIVAVQAGGASTMAREQGFEDRTKKEFPGIAIVDKQYGQSEVAQSLKVAENMLSAHPDLSGVFASNESSTMGAAQVMRARRSPLKLVGFDWGPSLKAGLEEGVIDSLIVQDPFRMGYESVSDVCLKLDGKPVQKINNLEPKLVTKADLSRPELQAQLNPNLKQYLD